ncbi:hypothetical protein, partial [Methylobacterium sp. WL18]|uniref:hypothetical protein n=1 Tax=Methylobacterium sp. WL18 TaxID=2603897 RepID=UPI001AED606E
PGSGPGACRGMPRRWSVRFDRWSRVSRRSSLSRAAPDRAGLPGRRTIRVALGTMAGILTDPGTAGTGAFPATRRVARRTAR